MTGFLFSLLCGTFISIDVGSGDVSGATLTISGLAKAGSLEVGDVTSTGGYPKALSYRADRPTNMI